MMQNLPRKIHTLLNLSDVPTPDVGAEGELLAAEYLRRRGLRIVCTNFKTTIGRNRVGTAVTGEIDIVALDESTLVFVEVKTRTSADFASPVTAVDRRKQRQIIRAARMYRKLFGLNEMRVRYDAVAVVLGTSGKPEIEHFRAFWNEEKFRRKDRD